MQSTQPRASGISRAPTAQGRASQLREDLTLDTPKTTQPPAHALPQTELLGVSTQPQGPTPGQNVFRHFQTTPNIWLQGELSPSWPIALSRRRGGTGGC
jgi:hypothetical protein